MNIKDFLKTFNNREVDTSNMDLFESWLKDYNNYWFSDGTLFIDNVLNVAPHAQVTVASFISG